MQAFKGSIDVSFLPPEIKEAQADLPFVGMNTKMSGEITLPRERFLTLRERADKRSDHNIMTGPYSVGIVDELCVGSGSKGG